MNLIIVVDMLKGFLEDGNPLYCGVEARAIIPKVAQFLRENKGTPRIYICDQHENGDPEFAKFPPHCLKGSIESEIIEELKEFPGKIVPKRRFSGFYETNLEQLIQKFNPEKVILVGVCTDICVLYTAADLRNRDYHTVVYADKVASFDPEGHKWALKHLEAILGVEVVY